MKAHSYFVIHRNISIVLADVLLAVWNPMLAATHIIHFGGTFGFTYSPNILNDSVGDTVRWEDDFGVHQLSSTSVPAAAQNFNQTSGSVFLYHVLVAGTYLYQCDVHFAGGMTGSFTSTTTDVNDNRTAFQPITNKRT